MKSFLLFILSCPWSQNGYSAGLDRILANHYRALGGYEKISSVQALLLSYAGESPGIDFRETRIYQRPHFLRREINGADRELVQVYDGEDGWMTNSGSDYPLAKILSEAAERPLLFEADLEGPLIDWRKKGIDLSLLGMERLGDFDCRHLLLAFPDGVGHEVWLDRERFLVRQTLTTFPRSGAVLRRFYADYRSVDGLVLPFQIRAENGEGDWLYTISLEKAMLNPPIDPAWFELPDLGLGHEP